MVHKLVAIGDSLTQGFQSFSINRTDLSYPAIIADCMGLNYDEFLYPNFDGYGGFPLNLEELARHLSLKYNDRIEWFDWFSSVPEITYFMDKVEDYWERGKGSQKQSDKEYHNLASWGFEVSDAYTINSTICKRLFNTKEQGDNWFSLPNEARLRTAYRVLNPSQDLSKDSETQISKAKKMSEDKGIENLIVWLGANNCLGTVVNLDIEETTDSSPGSLSVFNLWTPKAFERDYETLVEHILSINATNVFVATIPYVTIPPITRGIMKNRGSLPNSRKYFDYYAYFFVKDKEFDHDRDKHLTKEEVEHIEETIDKYNETIVKVANENNWHVVDLNDVLSKLASRRNHGNILYPLPKPIFDLTTRFFEVSTDGSVKEGGLISLDGVHPTTCGYGIVAQEFINVMRKKTGQVINDVDFNKVKRRDSLVSNTPLALQDVFSMLQLLEEKFHLSSYLKKKGDKTYYTSKFY